MSSIFNIAHREWNDDERDTTDTIKYYSDGWTPLYEENGITDLCKAIVRDERLNLYNLHWNEMEYRDYAYESLIAYSNDETERDHEEELQVDAGSIVATQETMTVDNTNEECDVSVDTRTQTCETDPPPLQEQDDLTYQGLVKNNFMYA